MLFKRVHHFIAIAQFQLQLQSGNAQIGEKFVLTSVTFDLWPLTTTFCMDITFVS